MCRKVMRMRELIVGEQGVKRSVKVVDRVVVKLGAEKCQLRHHCKMPAQRQ